MATYQGYQRYRRQREEAGFRIGKVVLVVLIFLFLYLIARAIFGGGKDNELDSLVNDTQNIINETADAVNVNAPEAANVNGELANTINANSATAPPSTFSADSCTQTYSRGSSERKEMALTFNVGTTKEGAIDGVLQALRAGNTPAVFFATGDVASENAELIQKISSAGFPVYNYGNSLVNFTDLPESGIREQLKNADASISEVTGSSSKPYFRPPFGSIDEDVLTAVAAEGYCPVTWTVDALDWSSNSTAASSRDRVLSKASNGAIILMQAGNSITSNILPNLISTLQEEGYSFVPLDRLLGE